MDSFGKAVYKRGKLYFDAIGWGLIKAVAKKQKKSPKYVVTRALLRYARKYGKKV